MWKILQPSPSARLLGYVTTAVLLAVLANLLTPCVQLLPQQDFWVGVCVTAIPAGIAAISYEWHARPQRREIEQLNVQLSTPRLAEQEIRAILTSVSTDQAGIDGLRSQMIRLVESLNELKEHRNATRGWWNSLAIIKKPADYASGLVRIPAFRQTENPLSVGIDTI